MRIQYAVALVIAIGLGLGAIASRGLAAQDKKPVYVVIDVNEITDADGFKALEKTGPSSIVDAVILRHIRCASNFPLGE